MTKTCRECDLTDDNPLRGCSGTSTGTHVWEDPEPSPGPVLSDSTGEPLRCGDCGGDTYLELGHVVCPACAARLADPDDNADDDTSALDPRGCRYVVTEPSNSEGADTTERLAGLIDAAFAADVPMVMVTSGTRDAHQETVSAAAGIVAVMSIDAAQNAVRVTFDLSDLTSSLSENGPDRSDAEQALLDRIPSFPTLLLPLETPKA